MDYTELSAKAAIIKVVEYNYAKKKQKKPQKSSANNACAINSTALAIYNSKRKELHNR